jgi:trehalose synthase-fused probable maltokinase
MSQIFDALQGDQLLGYLGQQRWFAAKGAGAASARIDAVIPLAWDDGAFAVVRVTVTLEGREQSYQLPLAARPVRPDSLPPHAVVASVEDQGQQMTVYDAVEDPRFRRCLADAFAAGYTAERGDARWTIASLTDKRLFIPEDAGITLASGEQSNTSIIFGVAAILKLFRKLEAGINPDVEVTEFLARRAAFPHAPVLLGTIRFEGAKPAVGGMVQELVPGARDAWTYALERGRPYFAAPREREIGNELLGDARRLGEITRELHEALAADHGDTAFAPERATAADLDRWAHRAQQTIRDGLALVDKQLRGALLPRERLAEAKVLVQRRDQYLAWVDELRDGLADDLGLKTRVHGDYHLGQVLRTAGGDFVIIDFEGEPARPLEERREKTSPLRDVAGMLRSIGYAAATLAREVGHTLDLPTRELRGGRWERDARAAFLDGYLAAEATDILPHDTANVHKLIALFETEKVFYELSYELNHRPDWVAIPMRGISKLLVAPSG